MVVDVVNVYLNVPIVKVMLLTVPIVMLIEFKLHHLAHVMMDIMKLMVNVIHVHTNVNYV